MICGCADASSPLASAAEHNQADLGEVARATHPSTPQTTPSPTLQLNTLPNSRPRLTDTARAAETDHTMLTLAVYSWNALKGASRCS